MDTALNSSLCLAEALAVGAAASVLVLELEDTDIAETADRGGGTVVVGHAVVIPVASFDDIRIGEGMDAHAFQSWTFDGLCCYLRDCSYAFLLDHSLVLCLPVEVASVQ